jgi:hypothetical protein
MLNATFSLLFIGAPVFFLGIALALRRAVQNRRKNAASFRGYFASGGHCDLLQHSDLSESEDWRADFQARFAPFRLRNPEPNPHIGELRRRGSRLIDQDPKSY